MSNIVLAREFLNFFDDKINRVIVSFGVGEVVRRESLIPINPLRLRCFDCIDLEYLKIIFAKIKLTYCDSDPFPVSEFKNGENFHLLLMIYVELINLSITTSRFPNSEKLALVKPFLKGIMDVQSLNSYRPVSNLTFLSKLLENVIHKQLIEFLIRSNMLPDEQSAYREIYSTETALVSIISDLILLMDEGKCAVVILLDLSAAFDTVVHELLMDDLRRIGVELDALSLLSDYLSNRTYRVQIEKEFSDIHELRRGVPQGSVLGPVLFCIYTIELAFILRKHGVTFRLFADDTQFYMAFDNIGNSERKLTEIMTEVKTWMRYKQLKLNEDKTECLLIGKAGDLARYDNIDSLIVGDSRVNTVKSVRDLGILLDSSLSMNDQITKVVRDTNYHLRNISFVKKYINKKSIVKLIHNHVMSRIDYCNSLYYGLPNYQLKRLQLLINRAARLVEGTGYRERITPVLVGLHWLPIKARIEYKLCIIVFQALRTGKPSYIKDLLLNFNPDILVHQITEMTAIYRNDHGITKMTLITA